MGDKQVFWAESIAQKAFDKKFHYLDAPAPKLKEFTVKSSASLSGVLHIGRLSDLLRGEAVFRALREITSKASFIYVTEDMDPLRKVPAGVPMEFVEYIGVPVSDVPDPKGCHESYAVHFKQKFLETFSSFLEFKPKVFSMREEYKKGNFTDYVLELVSKAEEVKRIVNKTRENPVNETWSPWKPICDNCGKLQTTVITHVDGKNIEYVCGDYEFESEKAKGCGHHGNSDLRKANGKLVWKSEWAAQWKRWSVVSEGAGKEYNAPNSAWFVNAEICERVLGFPMPEPIFYEHLMIDSQKMSASLGNVVYPHEWLEAGRPESLKLLYMKRLTTVRSFSWKDLPLLEAELDKAATIAVNGNAKDRGIMQMQSLYKYSAVKGRNVLPLGVDYLLLAQLSTLFHDDKELLAKLGEMGQLEKNVSAEQKAQLLELASKARVWVQKHGPEEHKLSFQEKLTGEAKQRLPKGVRPAIKLIVEKLQTQRTADEMQKLLFDSSKATNTSPKSVFQAIYLLLLGRTQGPKAGTLIFSFGKEKVRRRLMEFLADTQGI